MGRGTQQPPKTGPITVDEIQAALRLSGYPLEIRLLQAFEDAGLDPVAGHRVIPGDGEQSIEIDIMATATAPLANNAGVVELKAIVEAKQFVERLAFVGFKWKQPDAHSMRSQRIRVSGAPTCQVVPEARAQADVQQVMLGPNRPIAAALDPLNEPSVCRQWAGVSDHPVHDAMAKQDLTHRESFVKLVRVTTWLEEESTRTMLKVADPPSVRLRILTPTIVIATPQLYIYDPMTRTLAPTNSLILDQSYEAGGRVHRRFVDVVTEDGLPELVDRYKRAVLGLRDACDHHAGQLADLARRQSRAGELDAFRAANEELGRRGAFRRRSIP